MLKRLTPYVPWLALIVATCALFTDAKELRMFVEQNADVFPAWFLVGSGYAFLAFACLFVLYWVLVFPAWQAQLATFVLAVLPLAGVLWVVLTYDDPRPEGYNTVWPEILRIRPSLFPAQVFGVIGLLVLLGLAVASERSRLFGDWRE
jgi:hypothetical protein